MEVASAPAPADSAGQSGRALPRLAAAVATVGVGCALLTMALLPLVPDEDRLGRFLLGDFVFATVWPIAGAVVVRAAPRNAAGWVLVSSSLLGGYLLCGLWIAVQEPGTSGLFAHDLPAWFATWGYVPYIFVLPLVLQLFPNGRPSSPRWRWVVLSLVGVAVVTTGARMVAPVRSDLAPGAENPWSVNWAGLQAISEVGAFLCVLGGTVLGVVSLLLRSRRTAGVERQQIQWLMLGGIVLAVGFGAQSWLGETGIAIGLIGPPAGIAVAMVRHGLFDVAFALNRTIVYVLLSGVVVGGYAGAVLLLGSFGATSWPSLLLIAAAALLAAAVRNVVQETVDRWLFGYRRDPYAVVARVSGHIAPASEPEEALKLLVEALQRALRLPYVAFVPRGDGPATVVGESRAGWLTVPATALGTQFGDLHAGYRASEDRFGPEELGAIEEVAGRAGTLAYAAALIAEVADSRARIVVAREEERRRLRNDLHDGLGPALAGTAHHLDALARALSSSGDPAAAEQARVLSSGIRAAVTDVRLIVHGLRPPILDQLGLTGALERLVADYDVPRCTAEIADLAELPAAVEVACHAIASEAVANAVRHSAASRIELSAGVADQTLILRVADNGRGMPGPTRSAGVGLRSMADRAAEVGGRLELLAPAGGGTEVHAWLPISRDHAAGAAGG